MNRLKELRQSKKKTQQEMADIVGVTKRTYIYWEQGERQIKPEKAKVLADYFGVTVGYLLGYEDIEDLVTETEDILKKGVEEQQKARRQASDHYDYFLETIFEVLSTLKVKQNFKQATVINLIMLAVAAILYMDLRIVGNIDGTMSQVLYIVFFAFGILYMMVFLYIYPVLAKFYNSIKNTFRNAFLMAIRHLPYTVLMAVITLLPAGVFFIKSFRIQSMAIMLLCMFGFALEAFINGHFLVKIFDNYIPADADTQDTDLQNENSAETSSAENDHTV